MLFIHYLKKIAQYLGLLSVKTNVVYAVSFPKSGRSWLEFMIAKIYADLLHIPIEWFLKKKKTGGDNLPRILFGHGYKNTTIAQGKNFPITYYKNKKIFLLVRDPRDVVVSHYYNEKYRSKNFNGTISEFIRFPYFNERTKSIKARYGIKPIINYMNAWITNSNIFRNLFIAYYEDIRLDVYGQFKIILNYIGVKVPEHFIHSAIDYGQFDNMRRVELNGKVNWHGFSTSNDERSLKTRKGIVGGYQQELSPEDIDYINFEIEQNLDTFYHRYKKKSTIHF